jgi:ribose transport system permease protein
MKRRLSWDLLRSRFPALFPLILMLLAIGVNFRLQPNMFELDTLNQNMRVFLPLILLAAGQAVVLLGGGIDISAGAILSIVNTILATQVGLTGSPERMWQFIGISLLVGIMAGAFNGFFISYLRLQPIITTYATSFLYAGVALFILPNPGGGIPADIARLYRDATPLGLPLAFYVIGAVLLIWLYFSSSRYGKYLFAVGGKAEAAYETAVPVTRIQFGIYVVSGLMAALAGIAISMLTGSGNADIGSALTLNAITAVVIGGNAFSGGIGGVSGPIMGAVAISVIQNIVSFAHIDTWWETLVKATIIVGALAAPGLIGLFRRRSS